MRDWNLPLAQQTDRFLDLACVQYNGVDRAERYRRAQQLLEQTPGIADVNLFTAVVAGKLTLASDLLRANRALAQQPGGPRDWPPILYLTYSRISIDDAQVPVRMLRLLLEYGADPNSHTILWENRFTALTGAMGEGEPAFSTSRHISVPRRWCACCSKRARVPTRCRVFTTRTSRTTTGG